MNNTNHIELSPGEAERHHAEERARLRLSTIAAALVAVAGAIALMAEFFLKH